MGELQDMLKTLENAAPDKVLMDKLYESLIESMPQELYVIKEVPFNADVVNSEFCIYFTTERNMFSLWRYPAPGDDLPQYIRDAVKFFDSEYYERPKMVFIPFNVYGAYASRPLLYPEESLFPPQTLHSVCIECGLQFKVMTPERLKNKIKVV